MFFGSKKDRPAGASGSDSNPSDRTAAEAAREAANETERRKARQLLDWRASAQRVTHAWKAWLAADSTERDRRYRAYEAALAEEERAAAQVERALQPAEVGQPAEPGRG